ncbi:Abi family protein [Staphylococcus schleiferi subsp. coagulans]|uniref:Abi family protein n=1 Tax=Staphylococcus coagulans TaxID=74706 RepID=A0A9X0TNG8_9STAP|nr:Abi family protein [Staphylococcus coagulans]MBA8777519.1 Abi family protein [Staphylococcus coagulans]
MDIKVIAFSKIKMDPLCFKDFDEVISLYNFDSNIKTLFYKHVMFAEIAIKTGY